MRQNFLLIASAYCVVAGLSESYVSQKVYKKHDFIKNYREGKVSVSVRRYFELIDWFRGNWPEGAPWPDTFPIPKLGKNSADDETTSAPIKGID